MDRTRGRISARRSGTGLAVVGTVVLAVLSASAAGTDPVGGTEEWIVGFHPGTGGERIERLIGSAGAAAVAESAALRARLVRIPSRSRAGGVATLRASPTVAFVEPNRALPPLATPDDPYLESEWHLSRIRAAEAWQRSTGSPDVVIAILDSGVDAEHPDLATKLLPGWNVYDGNRDTRDVFGHGTRVAGAAAAATNNGIGVAAVAWQSPLLPVRVTDAAGYGYAWTIANGITWAADEGARVINVSFAGVAGIESVASAARYARSRGALVVAAAGNCGCDDPTPENPDLVSVGATNPRDEVASFSSRGEYLDLVAPGSGIYTTAPGGGYVASAGTSFASPIAAGVVALIFGANPALSPAEVEAILQSTALDLGPAGHDPASGFGLIDAAAALDAAAAIEPAPSDVTPPSVAIGRPSDDEVLSGTTLVEAVAFDDVGPLTVELLSDGILVAVDDVEPFTFAWDTTRATNGAHRLQARARDAGGNSTASAGTNVFVDNSANSSEEPKPTRGKGSGGGSGKGKSR